MPAKGIGDVVQRLHFTSGRGRVFARHARKKQMVGIDTPARDGWHDPALAGTRGRQIDESAVRAHERAGGRARDSRSQNAGGRMPTARAASSLCSSKM